MLVITKLLIGILLVIVNSTMKPQNLSRSIGITDIISIKYV